MKFFKFFIACFLTVILPFFSAYLALSNAWNNIGSPYGMVFIPTIVGSICFFGATVGLLQMFVRIPDEIKDKSLRKNTHAELAFFSGLIVVSLVAGIYSFFRFNTGYAVLNTYDVVVFGALGLWSMLNSLAIFFLLYWSQKTNAGMPPKMPIVTKEN
jgi:divalent metal cation (Fe/Co/Zn/Cd) transporter